MSIMSTPGDEEGIGGVVAPEWSTGGVMRNSFQNVSIQAV